MSFGHYYQETYLETQSKSMLQHFLQTDFQLLTVTGKNAPSYMFQWVLNRPWSIMSQAYLERSQKSVVEHFYENS